MNKSPRRILYWGDRNGQLPHDFVRDDINRLARLAVADILRGGAVLDHYHGHANCRFTYCRTELGCKDLGAHGFVWPEMAEHYILVHGVWTPDCDTLLAIATGS